MILIQQIFSIDLGIIGCVKWRQTGNCSSTGPSESSNDQACDVEIESGWSGYCECANGKAMEKGCSGLPYTTCQEACQGKIML